MICQGCNIEFENSCERCGSTKYKTYGQSPTVFWRALISFDIIQRREEVKSSDKWARNITKPKVNINLSGNTKSLIQRFQ